MTRAEALAAAIERGRAAVLGRADGGGTTEVGAPADLLVLDWDRVDDDRLRDDLDPLDLLFARTNAAHVDELRVGGRVVVKGGVARGVDEPDLRRSLQDRIRSAIAADGAFAAALQALEGAMRANVGVERSCC